MLSAPAGEGGAGADAGEGAGVPGEQADAPHPEAPVGDGVEAGDTGAGEAALWPGDRATVHSAGVSVEALVSTNNCAVNFQRHSWKPGAGFMNRRRLCQLTVAILTSD